MTIKALYTSLVIVVDNNNNEQWSSSFNDDDNVVGSFVVSDTTTNHHTDYPPIKEFDLVNRSTSIRPVVVFYNIFVPHNNTTNNNHAQKIIRQQLGLIQSSYLGRVAEATLQNSQKRAQILKNNPSLKDDNNNNNKKKRLWLFYNTIGNHNATNNIIHNELLTRRNYNSLCTNPNVHCHHMAHYNNGYEVVTLQRLYEFCQSHNNFRVVYLHTKGSYHSKQYNNQWRIVLTNAALKKEMCTSYTQ